MRSLLILGAGGHGKVCKEVAEAMGCYSQIDFLDDNADIAIGKISDLPSFVGQYTDLFCGIGNNKLRLELLEQAKVLGYAVPVLVHPTAYLSPSCKVQAGTVIEPKAIVNANTVVKEGCIISVGAIVDHDVIVNAGVHANAGSIVKAGATVEAMEKLEAGQVVMGYPGAVVKPKADSNSDFAKEEEAKTGKPVSFF